MHIKIFLTSHSSQHEHIGSLNTLANAWLSSVWLTAPLEHTDPTITVAAVEEDICGLIQCVFDNKIAETKCTVRNNFTAPHIA